MAELKKTPLNHAHRALGGRMVEFGGWDMPVQYTGVLKEHRAVREQAGLFDVSHMGEIEIIGPKATEVCQNLITNDLMRLDEDGKILYSAMCYPEGGVVDDILVYRFSPEHYFIVVNASNIEKDFDFMLAHSSPGADIRNVSENWGQIALQGPRSLDIIKKVTNEPLEALDYFTFRAAGVAGVDAIVSRTGYTGEDGFEIYTPANRTEDVWKALLENGAPDGLVPVGLGARDTLRLEMGYALYGHELSKDITPLEAGLGWVTKLDKGPFVGREALLGQKERGVPRKLIGLKLIERGIPREQYPVVENGRTIGTVTSGTMSPTLQVGIGMALVERDAARLGSVIQVEIRGKPVAAEVVKAPFVNPSVKPKIK